MEKKLNELQMKSISELTIPEQFQGFVHLTSNLINNQLDDSNFCEIFKIIDDYSINMTYIVSLLNKLSHIYPQKSSSFSNLYKMMQEKYTTVKFNDIMYFDIVIPTDSLLHLIIFDKIEEFNSEIGKENFDINQVIKYEIIPSRFYCQYTLIDAACKYGSEKCFMLLKLKGASISEQTSIYAVEGGNKNILVELFNCNEFEITDKHFTAALKYNHNDIFDWLLETKGSIGDLNAAECFSFWNIKGLLFLIENGFNINNQYIFNKLFILMIFYSSSL